MACNDWNSQLDAYLDGELASADAAALSAHMRTCPSCATSAIERVHLKRGVQQAGKRYSPSADLRAKIMKHSAAQPARQASLWWRATTAAVFAVLIVAGFIYSSHIRETARRHRIYSELADLHVATLASATPVDVVSTDRHTVKPWFQGKIPFTFALPELPGTEFTLLGGRVTYLAQTPGAHLIYQIRKHEISVLIFSEPGVNAPTLPNGPNNELSFTVESWTQNNLRYFVIGDASPGDIRALSDLLKAAK